MSRRRLLAEMTAPELALWMAEYALEAEEADTERPPTPEQLSAKLRAVLGAPGRRHGEVWQEPR